MKKREVKQEEVQVPDPQHGPLERLVGLSHHLHGSVLHDRHPDPDRCQSRASGQMVPHHRHHHLHPLLR